MKLTVLIFASLLSATAASAQTPTLKPALQGLGFLVGRWSTPMHGTVAETGGSSTGQMTFTPEVGGSVLLRKDHVNLYNASGKPTGGFVDIMMMIYPEAGGIHADYADGDHVIHYTSATVDPGRAVTFVTCRFAHRADVQAVLCADRPQSHRHRLLDGPARRR